LAAELGLTTRERALSPRDLIDADEAFIASSIREIAPVASVDGHRVGDGHPGAVTLRLLAAFRESAPLRCGFYV
jgi:branched-subunit amino acid aminotransferase/4-amino-4-deoxychorismate lyase